MGQYFVRRGPCAGGSRTGRRGLFNSVGNGGWSAGGVSGVNGRTG